MMNDYLKLLSVEQQAEYWEKNYKLVQKDYDRLEARHNQLEKNYNELLKRVYADTDTRRRD